MLFPDQAYRGFGTCSGSGAGAAGVLGLAGPWIGHQLLAFTFELFDRFPFMVR